MTARKALAGILLLLLLALLGIAGVLIARGAAGPALIGLMVGTGLGGLNLCAEGFSLGWALRNKPSAVLGVSVGGFAVRLVLVAVLIFVFRRSSTVSVVAFAFAYVASFFVFLVLQVWAVSRVRKGAGSPGGGRTKEAES